MTDDRTFGRILGETARNAHNLHLKLLSEAGTDFPRWVAFTLLAENQGTAAHDALVDDLGRRLETDRSAAAQIVHRMHADGHVARRDDDGTDRVELTAAGGEFLKGVRATVNQATSRLIGDLDPQAVETTMRVLRSVDDKAAALL
ncbi:MAG: MarR family winged helix-turn-helix transcriptional regulator [Nocardioidaceae bacterium]